ncbi:cytokine receptor family member B16 isoform X2 [Platichthys flesus]|uniref:cytokine receptor family member B16 isoform X2 n=1 Tax=Platichthys flesus TaxID=8260 RepID=UPI002DBEBD30|nr:cytokine receptor family member B16 isoform X2 [Platichthys flesus]
MRLRRTVSLLQMMIVVLLDGVWTLSAPDAVSMDSTDMRHTLRWRPLQDSCNTSILYSVQFQGEFELTVLDGSWVDAPECHLIQHTHCDLTLDLGSDSDYNIHVRGQCGSQPSAWAELRRPFNRRDTVLTVPEMKVSAAVQGLHVVFEKLPLTALVMVTVWRTGDELQAQVYSVTAEEAELEVAALQEGERYCVRAQSFMGTQLQSSSTDTQCVSITGPDATWRSPTTVTVTAIIMAGLLFAVFWFIVHWRPNICQTCFHKAPLPDSLQDVWDVRLRMSRQQLEVWERSCVVQSIKPEHQASETGTGFVSLLEEHSGDLLLTVDVVESFHPQRPQDWVVLDLQETPPVVGQCPVPRQHMQTVG